MKLYKKINLYFAGDYVCSTMQSKTCRDAKKRYLQTLENRSHSFAGLGLVESTILKYPKLLKAGFAHD